MCLPKPKLPKVAPVDIPETPPAPPPPEKGASAPRTQASKKKNPQKFGTRSLRIDLNVPSSSSGLGIPG